MITHRHISRLLAVIMVLAVCLCLAAVAFSEKLTVNRHSGVTMDYESELFDSSQIIRINILMDKADWSAMLQNAIQEEYYSCDVEVNGTTFHRVGIRPKGNTSLTSIANDPTTDRYSFKLEFDQYVDGQTCFGLDKLVLNNNYADATCMKEALVYDMFRYLGADASLSNYAAISVNGEYWGLYLALEAVEDSFLLRNYGVQSGELYKPESTGLNGCGQLSVPDGRGGGFSPADQSAFSPGNMQFSGDMQLPDSMPPSGKPQFSGGMGFSLTGDGADLNYTDDNVDNYSAIWDGEISSTGKADHRRVVTALQNISSGSDLARYMDIDNLLRYAAVHLFSVNEDSLSGTMAHNYYLYEHDGQLNLLPWDYNLAFGGMGSSDAGAVVNSPIDNAFRATTFFDQLLDDSEYHAQYSAYMRQLVDEYVNGGAFDTFYQRLREQIDSLVETDPTAFYSYEEYLTAVDTLYQVVQLRAQSISGQLQGTIPSTETAQNGSDMLIDASHLDIRVMGSMNTGGSFSLPGAGSGAQLPDAGKTGESAPASDDIASLPDHVGPSQKGNGMPDGFPSMQSSEEAPDSFRPGQSGARPIPDASLSGSGDAAPDSRLPQDAADSPSDALSPQSSVVPGSGDLPSTVDSGGDSAENSPLSPALLCLFSLIAAIGALVFAIAYRKPCQS